MNKQELFEVARHIKDMDRKEFFNIKEELGLLSSKRDEAAKEIYWMLIQNRRQNNEAFDDLDIRIFHWYFAGLSLIKNAEKAYEGESIEFMQFMKEYYEKLIKKYGYTSNIAKSYQRELNILEKIIYNTENAEEIKFENKVKNKIFYKLNELTKDTRKAQETATIERETTAFNNFKNADYSKLTRFQKQKYNEIKLHSQHFNSLDSYIDYIVNSFNRQFNNDLNNVAERIVKYGYATLDEANVVYTNNDPKFIELIIRIGDVQLHCRSILAAEYSEHMREHFRFIITEKKIAK